MSPQSQHVSKIDMATEEKIIFEYSNIMLSTLHVLRSLCLNEKLLRKEVYRSACYGFVSIAELPLFLGGNEV